MFTMLASVHSVILAVKTSLIIGGEKSATCIMLFDLHSSWSCLHVFCKTLTLLFTDGQPLFALVLVTLFYPVLLPKNREI
jgi:hypothetical protein